MTTTAADYSSFLQAFIYGGALLSQGAAVRIIEANTATQMVTDQTTTMEGMSPSSAAEQAYGLGWRLNGSAAAPWGQRGGERVFGHGGATGTAWRRVQRGRGGAWEEGGGSPPFYDRLFCQFTNWL